MTPSDRREFVLLAALALIVVAVLTAYLISAGSADFVAGLFVGVPIGGTLGWALDALLRWLVDRSNDRRRGRR